MHPATKRRIEELQRRKNFLPTLIITLILWAITGTIVMFTDPLLSGAVPLFFISSFFSLVFTFSLIFASTRRGILVALVITIFGILRYLGVGTFINFVLLLGIALAIELYFSRRVS